MRGGGRVSSFERLVCFSFASVFFCTPKENAQKRTIGIFNVNCLVLKIKSQVVGAYHESPDAFPLRGRWRGTAVTDEVSNRN